MNLRNGAILMPKIMIGDTVKVDGIFGPFMKVTKLEENGDETIARCIYFDDQKHFNFIDINTLLLERKEENTKTEINVEKEYNYMMHGISLDNIVTNSLKLYMIGEQKLQAIKEVRALSGLGLKEAKEFVEGIPYHIVNKFKEEHLPRVEQEF